MVFAYIYEGCRCQETWHVATYEDEQGDIIHKCTICNMPVTREKKDKKGNNHVHLLSKEEIQEEIMSYGYYNDYDEI